MAKMTEVVARIVTMSQVPERQVRGVLKALVAVTQEELSTLDGYVTIPGLGTFKARQMGNRNARNPRNGNIAWVKGYLKPTFKASSAMKDSINVAAGGGQVVSAPPAAPPAPAVAPTPAPTPVVASPVAAAAKPTPSVKPVAKVKPPPAPKKDASV